MREKKRSKNWTVVWVPSHRGILGNEKADEATHLARKEEVKDIITISDMPLDDWILQSMKKLFENWERVEKETIQTIGNKNGLQTSLVRESRGERKLYYARLELSIASSHTDTFW